MANLNRQGKDQIQIQQSRVPDPSIQRVLLQMTRNIKDFLSGMITEKHSLPISQAEGNVCEIRIVKLGNGVFTLAIKTSDGWITCANTVFTLMEKP
jgi:hypothetical protein